MVQLQNTRDIENPWVRWFMYGPTGAGKTFAAGTFPSPIFLAPKNEKSIVTLRKQQVDYIEIANRQDMQAAIDELRKRYKLMCDGDADAFPWETVVVESLSHYCELLVEDISRGGREKMDMQGWGLLSSHLRTVHSQLSDMDVHVVYTSLEAIDEQGQGKPLVIGKNAIMMPSACDVITYHEAPFVAKGKKPVYRTHFRQFGKFPARSRFQGMPDMLDDFSFSKIAQYLNA